MEVGVLPILDITPFLSISIPHLTYFSISHIWQMSPIRKIPLPKRLNDLAFYVPVWGYYLVIAVRD